MPALFPLYHLITNLKSALPLSKKTELETLAASATTACDTKINWLRRMW
ncbi:hypothetical protein SOHN41_00831 [Shewanella sp. HN-41]|nr:hypothetical protein SOHN41_00831 [Shewanella sp. HN-41]